MPKNAIIFGDSYSTFKDCVPAGYAIYYHAIEEPNKPYLGDPSKTWWHQVMSAANLNLVLNNSWSGSTIGYTGYNNADCSESSSFIYRLKKLTEEGFFDTNRINTVFVFGGTNDNWSNAPLGEMMFDDFKNDDLYCVLPAICYFLKTLKATLPNADIYCLINTELKPQITDCFKAACAHYGVTAVTFDCIDKLGGHPTAEGMCQISSRVLSLVK